MIAELADVSLALLFGGRSGEREVSVASARAALAALRAGGYAPREIDTGNAGWWRELDGVQLALNMQHGSGGEDGETQGLLAAMGIVCTGSGVLGSALSMDKIRSKRVWQSLGLPTPAFEVVDEAFDGASALASWDRLFIKPALEGSSLGMTRVDRAEALDDALAQARQHGAALLAEQFIDGPEYTVAILGDRALPPIRIEVAREFYDYEAKYRSGDTRYRIPCGLEAAEVDALQALARKAFEALDCAVWGRVDLMRDAEGDFYLLEVNTVPGMTETSLVPKAASAAGIGMTELVEEILLLSLEHAGGQP